MYRTHYDDELARVKSKLAAAKKKIELLKRDHGHLWEKQRPIENVLNSVFPEKKYRWRKNKEVLPNVWENLDTKPVAWHKYVPKKAHYMDFLSQKKFQWVPMKIESNVSAPLFLYQMFMCICV